MAIGARIKRRRDGRYALRFTQHERSLLKQLPTEAKLLVETNDASTFRLFPIAYPGDLAAEEDYRGLVGAELVERHTSTLDLLAETADATDIDESQLQGWLGALEVLRLVVGTRLDVKEDNADHLRDLLPGDPLAAEIALYHYLSWVQDEVIDALSAALPPGGSD